MRIIVLVLIAFLVTTLSFAEDRLDQVPSMSGKIEVMDQLGLVSHDVPAERIPIPPKSPKNHKVAPDKLRIHYLADIMTMGD